MSISASPKPRTTSALTHFWNSRLSAFRFWLGAPFQAVGAPETGFLSGNEHETPFAKLNGDPDLSLKVCAKDLGNCAGFCANPVLRETRFYDRKTMSRLNFSMEPRALTTLGLEESADELKKAGRKAEADAMKDPYEFASAMRWEFLCKQIWAGFFERQGRGYGPVCR